MAIMMWTLLKAVHYLKANQDVSDAIIRAKHVSHRQIIVRVVKTL